jgi:phosphoglycolate phosphatase-like HAD superfamily hydrolase
MIGDSAPDMEAGRRAGLKVCGVRYGYGDLAKMATFQPDYWIDDIRELIPQEVSLAAQSLSDPAQA